MASRVRSYDISPWVEHADKEDSQTNQTGGVKGTGTVSRGWGGGLALIGLSREDVQERGVAVVICETNGISWCHDDVMTWRNSLHYWLASVTGGFPSQRASNAGLFGVFLVVSLNKLLNKQ